MKSIVGVYESHDKAVQAVNELKAAGFAADKISLISKADIVNNHIHVKSEHSVERAEVSVGVAAGTILGALTGIGIFAIPGLGVLYGAGALVGAFAGLDIGLLGGGLVAILTSWGMDEFNAKKYEEHLNAGKFLVFVQGEEADRDRAQDTLHTSGLHMELDAH